jgi:hypothetical protein
VLTATISGLPAAPVLAFGGQPAKFTVTLHNGSGSTYRNIIPLLSIGHCSCDLIGGGWGLAPAGTLEELDPSTGNWHPVAYDTEGYGTDFLMGGVQPPFTLAPGATASFTFSLALAPLADQSPGHWLAGQTAVHVTVETMPAHTVIGLSPAAALPVTVTMPAS